MVSPPFRAQFSRPFGDSSALSPPDLPLRSSPAAFRFRRSWAESAFRLRCSSWRKKPFRRSANAPSAIDSATPCRCFPVARQVVRLDSPVHDQNERHSLVWRRNAHFPRRRRAFFRLCKSRNRTVGLDNRRTHVRGIEKPAPRNPSSKSETLRHRRFSSARSISPRRTTTAGFPEKNARRRSDFIEQSVITP